MNVAWDWVGSETQKARKLTVYIPKLISTRSAEHRPLKVQEWRTWEKNEGRNEVSLGKRKKYMKYGGLNSAITPL